MNLARFKVGASPSSDRGYEAQEGDELELTLEAPSPLVQRVTYEVYSVGDARAPLASLSAPLLTLVGATSGAKVDASSPTAPVTVTLPDPLPEGGSWRVRAYANGGCDASGRPHPDYVFERVIFIRNESGLRKEVPGELRAQSPRGPADAQNELVSVLAGNRVRPHTATHSPIALWRLGGDLLDSVGGVGSLVWFGGGSGPYWGEIAPGLTGLVFEGAGAVRRAASVAAANITGEMTLELILVLHGGPTSGNSAGIFSCGDTGESTTTNRLYELRIDNNASRGPRAMTMHWEHTSGTDVNDTTSFGLPLHMPIHLAYVRSGTAGNLKNRVYIGGGLVYETSGVLASPSIGGSPTTLFTLGAVGEASITSPMVGGIASVKLHNTALTAEQIAADADGCRLLLE